MLSTYHPGQRVSVAVHEEMDEQWDIRIGDTGVIEPHALNDGVCVFVRFDRKNPHITNQLCCMNLSQLIPEDEIISDTEIDVAAIAGEFESLCK